MKPLNFLVVGDGCTDVFVYGDCKRMCPEAPVPIFLEKSFKENGGMVKNVYNNMLAIANGSPHTVSCLTNRVNIRKTRYVDEHSNHIIMRIDTNELMVDRISVTDLELDKYDCVIMSDYNKGFLTEEDISHIALKSKLSFLDTKKELGEWSEDVTFIKINRHEYELSSRYIKEQIKHGILDRLIITKGKHGCTYNGSPYDVHDVEVKDLSGAGDTFLAAVAFDYTINKDLIKAIKFANECGTQVVQKRGIVSVNVDEL